MQVHAYVSTGLANSKFGIRNSHLQVRYHAFACMSATWLCASVSCLCQCHWGSSWCPKIMLVIQVSCAVALGERQQGWLPNNHNKECFLSFKRRKTRDCLPCLVRAVLYQA